MTNNKRSLKTIFTKDDGAALMLTLLTIVTIAGLSLLLLSALIGQYIPLYTAEKRTQAVYAAEAGLQAGLAELRLHERIATDGNTYGNPTALPCAAHTDPDSVTRYYGKLTGSVDSGSATDSGYGYNISISYHSDDPTGKSQSWVQNPSNQMHCGFSPANQPAYAVVTATGTGPGIADLSSDLGNRTVSAIYKFRVSNVNIPGGIIWTTDGTQCLRAAGTTANSNINFVPAYQCIDPANEHLVNWVYDAGWHIVLASTMNLPTDDLCIANTSTSTSPNTQAKLLKCGNGGNNSADALQRWEWNDNWTWNGMRLSGSAVVRNTNSKLYNNAGRLWVGNTTTQYDPSPAVGAGAASYLTKQLVNYKEFGRCADVTHTDINKEFMIVYPCKQDATGNNAFSWNHKWIYTEPPRNYATGVVPLLCDDSEDAQCKSGPQRIQVVPGATYCLTVVNPAGESELVFRSCTTNENQRFTRYTHVPDQAKAWTIQDAYGRCLTADAENKFETNWSKLRMKPCGSGSLDQKWNAPPQSSAASFGSFRELSE